MKMCCICGARAGRDVWPSFEGEWAAEVASGWTEGDIWDRSGYAQSGIGRRHGVCVLLEVFDKWCFDWEILRV